MHRSVSPATTSGFTLLEVLIAISITALIGLGAWQLLNTAIKTYEIGQESLKALSQIQRAQLNFSRDFNQLVPRSIRDEFGDYQPALKSTEDFYTVEFSRIGWRNPLQQRRSELQRVAYELNEGDLLRHHWRVMDRAQDSEPVTRRLLRDVERFEIAYLNESGDWVEDWPPLSAGNDEESVDPLRDKALLPSAVRVVLEHPRYGVITRLFELVAYRENAQFQTVSDSSGNNGNQSGNDDANSDSSGSGSDAGNSTGSQGGTSGTDNQSPDGSQL